MKTAALQHRPAEGKGGGSARKPFFSQPASEELQAKLKVGQPGDRYEVEADRVADKVVAGQGAGQLASGVTPLTQRQAEDEKNEEEEILQRQSEEEEETLQARSDDEALQREQDHPEDEETLQQQPEEEEAVQPRAQSAVLQREQDHPEDEETLQQQPEEEEEAVQPRADDEALQQEPDLPELGATHPPQTDTDPAPSTASPSPRVGEGLGRGGDNLQCQDSPKITHPNPPSPRPSPTRGEGEELALRAEGNTTGTTASAEISRQIRASRGGGNPLPGPLREKMEAQFGVPLDGVRIHTDAPAVLLARSLRAQAFTRGPDIFFNEGRFAPDSRSGQHLLAHELTHTIQQGAVQPQGRQPEQQVIRLAGEADGDSYQIRPELLEAIKLARGEIGKVNSGKSDADGKRVGWQHLREYFHTALGGEVISDKVIERITLIEKTDGNGNKTRKDALPSWCGIFTWWALKKAGIPIPDWKLGVPGLNSMKQRAPGELPRKGDIVIHLKPYNHFAMVTGVESSKDAEGKPRKLIRVATINGNTAGEDNLGGQVQERWHELKHWDFVFDPVGKLNLPDVPLVTTSREPDAIEPAAPSAEQPGGQSSAADATSETSERGPTADQLDLDSPVAEPEADLMGGPLPEPDLSLPPPVEQGPAEQVAEVKQVDLAGSSDQATTAFIDASPSSMAATQPHFGSTVDGKMQGEQQDLVNNPPVLEAKTAGSVAVPLGDPSEIPVPGNAELGDGVQGQEPGDLPQASVASPQPFRGNAERERELDNEDSGSFWDRFKNFLRKFTQGIRTSDGSIATGAGERPQVALSAEADPERMDTPREEGTTALKGQRDTQVEAFRNNPGQAKIQPRMLDEQYPSQLSAEPTASIDSQSDDQVAAYAAAPLPEDVRANADARISKQLRPNLAEARSQTTQAASTRDSEKKREIDSKQQAAQQLNADTDAAQRTLVIENRSKVAGLQGEGIGQAHEQVNAFSREAAGEQGRQRKAIGDHVKSEEGKARTELDNGEKDAEKEKAEGERQAAEKKKELEKEQKKGSWWDRVKSAIKKAVKVITDAIDKVFTAVRKAVKDIIEKAKNAAIGLINKARNWVVGKLNDFRNWAKDKVNKYLKDSFPGLARRINNGIDAVTDTAIKGVNKLADGAIAGINKLADALAKALDKILATFQTALKTAVRVVGAVLQGDFAEALRAAIEGACEIAGVDSKPVFDFFDRAGKAIMSILKDPVRFIRQLFGAIGSGIGSFFKNIKTHLIQGVIGWLTGALSEVNITGPFEFSPRGILSIVMQVLGLTYANIKARVIRKVPAAEKVFDLVEKGYALLKRIITEGPGALWEEIKSRIASLKETVMGAIRNWLIVTAIKEGIVWLLSLTNPASAIVKAIKLVYDLVMFLVERYQQIKEFILRVYEAVAAVASGNFTKVTQAVEGALARSVPVLISLFASVLGLGNIAKQVKGVIETITKPINKAIDWVVDKVVAFARKIIARVKGGAKKVKDKAKEKIEQLINWWKEKRKFKSKDGGSHSIYYQGEGRSAHLMVASDPDRIESFLARKQQDDKAPADQKAVAKEAAAQYKQVQASEDKLEKLRAAREKVSSSDKNAYRAATSAVNAEIRNFRNELDALKTILARASFENEDDALVRTHVAHNAGGDKSSIALPLTYLSGNTKGSSPYQDPPGWAHAVALDTKEDGSSRHQWVRGHLLNDNLHGPGTADNMVPITQSMNRQMETQVESPAKSAIKEKGKLFFYKAVATFWKKPAPIDAFPKKIVVTWGTAERDTGDKSKFHEKTAKTPVTIEMPTVPPEKADAFVPSINGGSPGLLLKAIHKHDGSVTGYFVSELLLAEFKENGAYSSKSNMKDRLWQKGGTDNASKRRQHVNATYTAITAGDVQV